MNKLSPIVLFVFNRPDTTLKTIEYLQENTLAQDSDLHIFSDNYRNEKDIPKVEKVRSIISNVTGFKSVSVYKSDINKGLADSVVQGIEKILNVNESVIVLEDDILTSPFYLEYMNNALNFYKNNPKIWSISGYNPIDLELENDVYFTRRGSSWGWGTWADRWKTINWDIQDKDFYKIGNKKRYFNECGNDMYPMLLDQKKGYVNSWAIRWCFNQFVNDMLTVYPSDTLVSNIGLSGDSTHGSFSTHQTKLKYKKSYNFIEVYEDDFINEKFKKHYDLKFRNYIGFILKRVGAYKRVKKIVRKILK